MATCGREIHVGDVGTVFRVTLYDCDVIVDLTGYNSVQIKLQKPDETVDTHTATIYQNDPTLGIIEYITQAGDLDQDGLWQIQGYVDIPTWTGHSDTEKFKVYTNLS